MLNRMSPSGIHDETCGKKTDTTPVARKYPANTGPRNLARLPFGPDREGVADASTNSGCRRICLPSIEPSTLMNASAVQ